MKTRTTKQARQDYRITALNKDGGVVIGHEPKNGNGLLESQKYRHLKINQIFKEIVLLAPPQPKEPPVPILKIVVFSLAVTLGATGLLLAISWLLSLVIH